MKTSVAESKFILVERGFILGACAICFGAGVMVGLFFARVFWGLL